MAAVWEQRLAYLTYPARGRLHSDRLAGLFTPFRRRDNTRLTLSHYLVVSTLTHPVAKYKPLFAIFSGQRRLLQPQRQAAEDPGDGVRLPGQGAHGLAHLLPP